MVADIHFGAALEVAEMCRAAADAGAGNEAGGCHVEAVCVDVTSEQSVRAMMDHAKQKFGRVDYCVNSAGVSKMYMHRRISLSKCALAVGLLPTASSQSLICPQNSPPLPHEMES